MFLKQAVFTIALSVSAASASAQDTVHSQESILGNFQDTLDTEYGSVRFVDMSNFDTLATTYGIDSVAYNSDVFMINDVFYEIEGCEQFLFWFCEYIGIDSIGLKPQTDTLNVNLFRLDNNEMSYKTVSIDDFLSMLSKVSLSDDLETEVPFNGGKLNFHRIGKRKEDSLSIKN